MNRYTYQLFEESLENCDASIILQYQILKHSKSVNYLANNKYLKLRSNVSIIKLDMESVKSVESIMELAHKLVHLIWPINWKLVPIKMVYFFFAMGMKQQIPQVRSAIYTY